jgi:hypothetical protein
MLAEAVMGEKAHQINWQQKPQKGSKPHGRTAFIFLLAKLADDFEGKRLGAQQYHAVVDLSVMPRL